MTETLRPDLCIVGAGSAGLSVAAAAAALGVPVVLIERGQMGGDCLNAGCVPSKALIAAARRAHDIRQAADFGLGAPEPQVNYARVREHVRSVIGAIAPNDSQARFTALGVRVVRASARFVARDTLEAGNVIVKARRFVLATGSRPAVPDIPGLDTVPFLTNGTVFDLTRRPEHLVVLGGGPVGLELAQAHRRLGTPVTVIEAGRALCHEDPELAAHVLAALARDGVVVREGATVREVAGEEGDIRLVVENRGSRTELKASHLLVATGRRPVTDGLELAAAGIAHDEHGITVDQHLRTTNRRVYAIGDCAGPAAGGRRFTHVASYHAGLVIRSALFRLRPRVDMRAMPRVIFTDPELAVVGMTEEEARADGTRITVLRWPLAENDRAQAERRTEGEIKVILGRGGRILGCGIVAAGAGELITPWTLAIAHDLKIRDLAELTVPYPTLSEISRRVAMSYYAPSAARPMVRRLIGLLRRFG